ncbi:histidine phosphatase family protein [Thermolongibacillus altinsuensis]
MVHHVAITFIRHGMTAENEAKQYIGWTDVPLSEKGMKQLKTGSYPTVDFVIASDLLRCHQTARCLFPHLRVEQCEHWRELHFGEFEGKTYEELKAVDSYGRWLADPFGVAPPNGESFLDFQKRIEQGIEKTLSFFSASVRHIAVVTHGGPIRYILSRYAPETRSFWEWSVPFGGGFTLYSTLERWRRRERCISLAAVPFKESENG